MSTTFRAESTLTERYQTTVPETVRRALGLKKRDKIHYNIHSNGRVVLSRAKTPQEADPALTAFLNFLARDIALHPEQLTPLTGDLLAAVQSATQAAQTLDLDASLSLDDE